MDGQTPNTNAPTPAPPDTPIVAKHGHRFLAAYLTILLMALAAGGVYAWQHKKVTDLNKQVTDLQSQINSLTAKSAAESTDYLTVEEWGVKIPETVGATNITYTYEAVKDTANKIKNVSTAAFRSAELNVASGKNCVSKVNILRGAANSVYAPEGIVDTDNPLTFSKQFDINAKLKDGNISNTFHAKLNGYFYLLGVVAVPPCGHGTSSVDNVTEAREAIYQAINLMVAE